MILVFFMIAPLGAVAARQAAESAKTVLDHPGAAGRHMKQAEDDPPVLGEESVNQLSGSHEEPENWHTLCRRWQELELKEPLAAHFGTEAEDAGTLNIKLPDVFDLPTPLPDLLVCILGYVAFKLAQQFKKQDCCKPDDDAEGTTTARIPFSDKEGTDAFGCTALHRAAYEGNCLEVRKLLESRSNPNAREAWDETPLHMAARLGQAKAARLLLRYGADPQARNASDQTALEVAAGSIREDEDLLKLLGSMFPLEL